MPVPDGWAARAQINRILQAGLCSYTELKNMSIEDVYYLISLLDWRDYAQGYADNGDR